MPTFTPLLISLRFAAGVNHARSSLPFSNSLPAMLLPRLLPASHWISSPLKSDSEEGRELCQRFKVRALPTVVAFQGGKAIKAFTSALREHQVYQFLREI